MTVKVRFAPSPTGKLHVGNARPALFNWFFAQRQGGSFLLRFDDTDRERSTEAFAEGILRDLDWLGLKPDRIERQSARLAEYQAAAERLKAEGRLYPCYETADELERQRSRQRARGLPPIYDRRALKQTDEERRALEEEGRRPHWRFLLPNFSDDPFSPSRTEESWHDLVRGEQAIDLASMSDPVLVREDGTFLYTLPSVVDDIEFGITHVIRGEDHVTNTGAQIALFKALGAEAPVFGHHNLLQSEAGEALSKRLASLSLQSLRDEGIEGLSVAIFATLVGTSEPIRALGSMSELAELFSLDKVSRTTARFSHTELLALNGQLVATLPYAAVAERLSVLGVAAEPAKAEAFWEAVRGNCGTVAEALDWWHVVAGPVEPVVADEDRDFLSEAASLLPAEPWDGATWGAWTGALKQATGRKGRSLFMPLRLALTGLASGPELAALLPVIGRPSTLARLNGS
ncbi:glutamyl-tRNA synthetase [Faunimonas pinastri]|uniref:Glutamate--tRNA ligase n=1 Tax=Faunimonas pinastri TaxID=1855383 RepID=A0A1H9JBF1_9HYPH|nr:glutamate--tRNA ligase [Faunimonas pinastri]SEQ84142.1 glutamyl-tRNA synthetase [Faunimonas pinastri]